MNIDETERYICRCDNVYTIEPHGPDGYALYFGRCEHRHGYNLCKITDVAHNCNLENIEKLLNRAAAAMEDV